MRPARALSVPRRTPMRVTAPIWLPTPPAARQPAPPPRPPAHAFRQSAPERRKPALALIVRPPTIVVMLGQRAIALALRPSVISQGLRAPRLRWSTIWNALPWDDAVNALRSPTKMLGAARVHGAFALKLAGGALISGMVTLAVVNNLPTDPATTTTTFELASNETIIVRQPPPFQFQDEEEADLADAGDDHDGQPVSFYKRAIETVRFLNPNPRIALASAVPGIPEAPQGIVKVHGFAAFSPKEQVESEVEASTSILRRRKLGGIVIDDVDDYLWEVYQRQPIKRDSTGDFTWKDPAAANRMGLSLEDYVIGGMDPDFRQRLYQAGRAMDADGIRWSMLSAFRDDYRQSLASGFKARTGNSLHGGSRRTGGYGHGRAIDITTAEGDAEVVWKWLDVHGAKFGLHRPMPGADPAHIQELGESPRKISIASREARNRVAAVSSSKHKRKIRVARAGK
jgi:hypothetical protein